jgi:hypothetical protein
MLHLLIRRLLATVFILLSLSATAQVHNAVGSVGYGFPSILRFALSHANINEATGYYKVLNTSGVGPLHFKAEYVYKKRLGIGFSGVLNTLRVNYATKFEDTFQMNVQEQVFGGRLNCYIINKPKQQLYIGAGLGFVDFYNLTKRTNNITDTFNATFVPITAFQDKKTFEVTIGYRYFPSRHLGLYVELGSGKVINQFRNYGFIDSWGQAGLTWRLNTYSKIERKPKKVKVTSEPAEIVN